MEDVGISGAEDDCVEHLGDHGDTLGAPIAVDGEHEDAFRKQVGAIAQDSEYLQGEEALDGVWQEGHSRCTYIPTAHGVGLVVV